MTYVGHLVQVEISILTDKPEEWKEDSIPSGRVVKGTLIKYFTLGIDFSTGL